MSRIYGRFPHLKALAGSLQAGDRRFDPGWLHWRRKRNALTLEMLAEPSRAYAQLEADRSTESRGFSSLTANTSPPASTSPMSDRPSPRDRAPTRGGEGDPAHCCLPRPV